MKGVPHFLKSWPQVAQAGQTYPHYFLLIHLLNERLCFEPCQEVPEEKDTNHWAAKPVIFHQDHSGEEDEGQQNARRYCHRKNLNLSWLVQSQKPALLVSATSHNQVWAALLAPTRFGKGPTMGGQAAQGLSSEAFGLLECPAAGFTRSCMLVTCSEKEVSFLTVPDCFLTITLSPIPTLSHCLLHWTVYGEHNSFSLDRLLKCREGNKMKAFPPSLS